MPGGYSVGCRVAHDHAWIDNPQLETNDFPREPQQLNVHSQGKPLVKEPATPGTTRNVFHMLGRLRGGAYYAQEKSQVDGLSIEEGGMGRGEEGLYIGRPGRRVWISIRKECIVCPPPPPPTITSSS